MSKPCWSRCSLKGLQKLLEKSRGVDPQDELDEETYAGIAERIEKLQYLKDESKRGKDE